MAQQNRRTWSLAVAVALAGGCASSPPPPQFSQPPVASFRAGACQQLAPHVLTVGRVGNTVSQSATAPAEVGSALSAAQDGIRAAQQTLDSDIRAPVEELLAAVGVLRLRVATQNFEGTDVQTLSSPYDRVIEACT